MSSKSILIILSYTISKLVHFLRHSVECTRCLRVLSSSLTSTPRPICTCILSLVCHKHLEKSGNLIRTGKWPPWTALWWTACNTTYNKFCQLLTVSIVNVVMYVARFLDQELTSYLVLVVGVTSSKKPKSFQIGSGWSLARMFFKWMCIDWQSQIFDLTSHIQDGGHYIILCRKVLTPGESTQSICLVPVQQCMPVPDL